MCTVTYSPYKQHGFVLTSSRDEQIERVAEARIVEHKNNDTTLIYPEEPVSKGTWFGCSSKGITGCLLNGAFKKYERKPPYRQSRGLIFLEVLNSLGSKKTLTSEFLENIEPFTLVLIKYQPEDRYVQEFRWDGIEIHNRTIDPESPHLWASAALFSDEAIEEKKANYGQLVNELNGVTPEKLFQLHFDKKLTGQPYHPEFSKLKGGMINISQVAGNQSYFELTHMDVNSDTVTQKKLSLDRHL